MAACWPLQLPPTPKAVLISLADQANDQGGCWPALQTICERTCLGERAVRNALRWLEQAGLLTCEARRRKSGEMTSNFYTVTPSGFNAAAPAPAAQTRPPTAERSDSSTSASDSIHHRHLVPAAPPAPGAAGTTGTSCPLTVKRKHRTNTPPNPPPGGESGDAKPVGEKRPREAKPQLTLTAWLALCKAKGEDAIPETDAVFSYCDTVGISRELLRLHWGEFKRRRTRQGKRQADWRQTFRNSVEDNWYRLWFIRPGQPAELTTQGHQAKALQEAEALRRAQEREAAEAQPA